LPHGQSIKSCDRMARNWAGVAWSYITYSCLHLTILYYSHASEHMTD